MEQQRQEMELSLSVAGSTYGVPVGIRMRRRKSVPLFERVDDGLLKNLSIPLLSERGSLSSAVGPNTATSRMRVCLGRSSEVYLY